LLNRQEFRAEEESYRLLRCYLISSRHEYFF